MKRTILILISAAALAAPVWAQLKVDQIVARVNADIILKSEMDREMEIRRVEKLQDGKDPGRVEQELSLESETVLRDLIDRTLVIQVAKEAGLSAELDLLKTLEQLREERKYATMDELEKAIIKDYGDLEEFKNDIRTKFLWQQVIDHEVYSRIVITNEEMRKFYEEHQSDFDKPAGIRLSEIVVLIDRRIPDQVATQRKKIEEAHAALKSGEDFATVVQKYSEDASASRKGDVGFVSGDIREQTNEIVAKALENLGKNQFTEIVELNDAFVIYKVTDKHDGGILPFDLAQQYIWPQFMSRIAPEKVREFLTRLRSEGFVDVKPGYKDLGAPPRTQKSAATTP